MMCKAFMYALHPRSPVRRQAWTIIIPSHPYPHSSASIVGDSVNTSNTWELSTSS